MKKLILTCAIIISATIMTKAQEQTTPVSHGTSGAEAINTPSRLPVPTPEEMAERKAKDMQAKLSLTDDQYKKSYDAELAYARISLRPINQVAQSTQKLDHPATQTTIQKAIADRDASYKRILTQEQLAKYNSMRPKTPPSASIPQTPAAHSAPNQ